MDLSACRLIFCLPSSAHRSRPRQSGFSPAEGTLPAMMSSRSRSVWIVVGWTGKTLAHLQFETLSSNFDPCHQLLRDWNGSDKAYLSTSPFGLRNMEACCFMVRQRAPARLKTEGTFGRILLHATLRHSTRGLLLQIAYIPGSVTSALWVSVSGASPLC